jgi:hypothetical protein
MEDKVDRLVILGAGFLLHIFLVLTEELWVEADVSRLPMSVGYSLWKSNGKQTLYTP